MSGIAICYLQGNEVNCSEIFTPVVTDSGVCCAFNLHMDLKESQYSELVEEMQVNFRNSQMYVAIESFFLGEIWGIKV